jgi:hypothetical protein
MSIFKKKTEYEYKVVECKTEHGVHYEIYKNGLPEYKQAHTKFGPKMVTDKWDSYRSASRALQNRHYPNGLALIWSQFLKH